MTNPDYRDLCAELVEAYVWCIEEYMTAPAEEDTLIQRARALLDQPVAEGTKPVVDYSRVPEIATEAQIRSAAQYLVKKRNCDGDLISAIEYAIARWGRPTPQPVAVRERLPGPEDCLDEGWAWFFNQRIGWRQAVLPVSTGYTHWLPANALPTPEATND
jgi:hypothetical protein